MAGQAISVSDEEIQSLQLAVSSGMPKQPWPYLEVGQPRPRETTDVERA